MQNCEYILLLHSELNKKKCPLDDLANYQKDDLESDEKPFC
jgi:hypothetical protein